MTRRRAIARAVFRIALRTLKWGTLAAALLVAGVWAGGKWATSQWMLVTAKYEASIGYGKGGIVLTVWKKVPMAQPGSDILLEPAPVSDPVLDAVVRREVRMTVLEALRSDDRKGAWKPIWLSSKAQLNVVMLPYWIVVAACLACTTSLFWSDRRAARRARVGMCPSCGYSRAGLALDAVCPECGKPKV